MQAKIYSDNILLDHLDLNTEQSLRILISTDHGTEQHVLQDLGYMFEYKSHTVSRIYGTDVEKSGDHYEVNAPISFETQVFNHNHRDSWVPYSFYIAEGNDIFGAEFHFKQESAQDFIEEAIKIEKMSEIYRGEEFLGKIMNDSDGHIDSILVGKKYYQEEIVGKISVDIV